MNHPFDDPALQLLKAAADAADTPGRQALLEGLLDGQGHLVRQTLEDDHEHGELLDDDFFWCFMGVALTSGDEEFWKTVGEWGYSLDSEVSFPDPENTERWREKASIPVAAWAMQLLPPERLRWFEEIGQLKLWRKRGGVGMSVGERGMALASPEVFDWLLAKWEAEKRNPTSPMSKETGVPAALVTMGAILAGTAHGKPPAGMPPRQEMDRRYDLLARAYLAWRAPDSKELEQQVAVFSSSPPTQPDGLKDLARWMVGAAPGAFEGAWFTPTLQDQGWAWAREAWMAGAQGPGTTPEPQASATLFEALLDAPVKHFTTAMTAVKHWVGSLSKDQARKFLEGSAATPRTWVALQKGRLDVAQEWIKKGADLKVAHPGTGEQLGSYILRGVLGSAQEWDSTPRTRKELWDVVMKFQHHKDQILHWWDGATMSAPLLALADARQWALLKDLIEKGAPLDGGSGMGVGLKLLECAVRGAVDGDTWDAYKSRADEDSYAPSSRFLDLGGEEVESTLRNNEEAIAELAEWALKHALPEATSRRPARSRI